MAKSRREFLKYMMSSSFVTVYSTMTNCNSKAQKMKLPSYIIFLSDDLGYGDLACYGNPINKTPNIDKFATEGIRFTDCHSGGTVCSPSRASLLTGRNPYRSGFYYIAGGGAHLQREEITIAKLLKDKNYDTCLVGKWHLSHLNRKNVNQPTPGDHGFDHWFATEVNAFEGPENPKKFIRNGVKTGEVKGWYCDVIVEEAVDWLKNRPNSDKPFFLLVCSHEPHTPLGPPEKYAKMYDNPEVEAFEKTINYGDVERPENDISENKKFYYGTVSQLDNAFGNLMSAVDGLGLRKNTLVFFTSDNGPEAPVNLEESRGEWEDKSRNRCFGTPGVLRGMKRFPYEGGHKVPGIARWPEHIQPGTVSNELINGTDILPTLCELSDIPVPKDRAIDGISVVSALKGQTIKRNKPICWIFPAHEDTYYRMPHIAMRENNYVLIAWFNKKEKEQLVMDWIKTANLTKFELYNIDHDITQSKDLSEDKPEKLKFLIKKLEKHWEEIQTEGPVWEKWKMK